MRLGKSVLLATLGLTIMVGSGCGSNVDTSVNPSDPSYKANVGRPGAGGGSKPAAVAPVKKSGAAAGVQP